MAGLTGQNGRFAPPRSGTAAWPPPLPGSCGSGTLSQAWGREQIDQQREDCKANCQTGCRNAGQLPSFCEAFFLVSSFLQHAGGPPASFLGPPETPDRPSRPLSRAPASLPGYGEAARYSDFDPKFCIRNYSDHRLCKSAALIRDDSEQEEPAKNFREHLERCNEISRIKADFYGRTEYPGALKNHSTVYLTVTTI